MDIPPFLQGVLDLMKENSQRQDARIQQLDRTILDMGQRIDKRFVEIEKGQMSIKEKQDQIEDRIASWGRVLWIIGGAFTTGIVGYLLETFPKIN